MHEIRMKMNYYSFPSFYHWNLRVQILMLSGADGKNDHQTLFRIPKLNDGRGTQVSLCHQKINGPQNY